MSVLIKGMEMPPTCRDCFVMCDNYDKKTWRYARHKNCPLVEIPTPHGDLVDFDQLQPKFVEDVYGMHQEWFAPTVIESEE